MSVAPGQVQLLTVIVNARTQLSTLRGIFFSCCSVLNRRRCNLIIGFPLLPTRTHTITRVRLFHFTCYLLQPPANGFIHRTQRLLRPALAKKLEQSRTNLVSTDVPVVVTFCTPKMYETHVPIMFRAPQKLGKEWQTRTTLHIHETVSDHVTTPNLKTVEVLIFSQTN